MIEEFNIIRIQGTFCMVEFPQNPGDMCSKCPFYYIDGTEFCSWNSDICTDFLGSNDLRQA